MVRTTRAFWDAIHNGLRWLLGAVFVVLLGLILANPLGENLIRILVLGVITTLLCLDYVFEFPWHHIRYIRRYVKIPEVKRIAEVLHKEYRTSVDGRPIFYAGHNAELKESMDACIAKLGQYRISWWNRPILYYTLGLREKLSWVDVIYFLLIRELANLGIRCVMMIHQEGYVATSDKSTALDKFRLMEHGIKKILQAAPCEIYFSYDYARRHGRGVFTKTRLHDFVYFDMLYLVRTFGDSVLEANRRLTGRLKSVLDRIKTIDTSQLNSIFNELIHTLKLEMNQESLKVYMLLDHIRSNPGYPDPKFVCQQLEKVISMVENPFHTRRMVNQLANTLDLFPILSLTRTEQPLFLLCWEYEAEKWHWNVQQLANFAKIVPLVLSGNTLRNDLGYPVPVYEENLSINLRDSLAEIHNKIFVGGDKLGRAGTGNIYKLLSWDVDLVFHTWEELLERIQGDFVEEQQFRKLLNFPSEILPGQVVDSLNSEFVQLHHRLPWRSLGSSRITPKDACKGSDIELFYLRRKALDALARFKKKYGIS